MSSSSITKIPQCIYCGQVFETWTGNKCECEGATESRAARQADLDAKAAIQAEANQRLIPIAPVVVDDGWARLRREAAKDQAAARQDADIADRERAVKERELSRRERRQDDRDAAQDTDTPTGPTDATLDALAAVFDDEVDLTPTPAVLERGDGAMVLPAGKLNWIYGLPGTGKSFLCEIDLIMAVMRGGRALYLDYEDSAKTFHQRAAMLGFNLKDYSDCFKYIHGGPSDYPAAQTEAMAWLLEAPNPEMNQVIIDAAESSGCPSDGAPVNDWLEKVVLPWRSPSVNSGVLVNDHIPKTKDNRPDGPIGSQRKMAAVDGISILVGGYCWSKTKSGRITLINDKDRTGQFGKKDPVATIIGTWEGEGESRGFSYRITESIKEDSANANIGGELLTAVAEAGPLGMVGKNNLGKCVGGNRNIVFQTIDALVEGGMLATKKAGQTITYMLTEEGLEYVD